MFVRFDEIPAMTSRYYGTKSLWTDNMKIVYPPQAKFAGGIN